MDAYKNLVTAKNAKLNFHNKSNIINAHLLINNVLNFKYYNLYQYLDIGNSRNCTRWRNSLNSEFISFRIIRRPGRFNI